MDYSFTVTLIVAFVFGYYNGVFGDLEPVLQRCCESGEVWARNHTACNGPGGDVSGLQGPDRLTCLTALYACCVRTHRRAYCESGKNAARTRTQCTPHTQHGAETFKDCCDGCTLGLLAESMHMPCAFSRFSFGPPWDEAFQDCCNNPVSALGTSPQLGNGPCSPGHPCSQVCEIAGGQPRCSCLPGFKLAQDGTTCNDLDECALQIHNCNPATETCTNKEGYYECLEKSDVRPRTQCPQGYTFNSEKRTCDDVNECLEDICPKDLFCVNTKGSYTCVPGNSTLTRCMHGFVYQPGLKRCIDVDECHERIDNCDRTRHICQNSHGSYQCLDKPSRSKNCPAGFKWNEGSANCDDVDECTERIDDCAGADQVCRNTVGGYECDARCPPLQIFNYELGVCMEADKCASGQHNCTANEVCIPKPDNKVKCVQKRSGNLCFAGFKPGVAPDGNTEICEDVNECTEFPDACDPQKEVCHNTDGGYDCLPHTGPHSDSCPDGFRMGFSSGRLECVDINECVEQPHLCNAQSHLCVNTEGSFDCILRNSNPSPSKTCPQGFETDSLSQQCIDIDECAFRTDTCDRRSEECVNQNGTFTCVPLRQQQRLCPPGYRPGGTGCEDINECTEGRHKCQPDKEQCQNVPGAYRCQQLTAPRTCAAGKRFDTSTGSCEDVNECEENTHNCDLNTQNCLNSIGSYRCITRISCPHGYRWNPAKSKCDDSNECLENTHDCDHRTQFCINTPGSYQCQSRPGHQVTKCGRGYVYDNSRETCVDLNECEVLRPCENNEICENTQGSYKCVCPLGYTLDAFTRQCNDINECQLQLHSCEDSQRCDNTVGSFTCVRLTSCGTGYTLNAATSQCEDDDECVLGHHNCGPGFACRNTFGSFRCDRIQCPAGQKLLSDGSCKVIVCGEGMQHDDDGNCIDINECALNNPCRLNQRCINIVGSYRCQNLLSCSAGFELNEIGDQCVDVDECTRNIADCGPGQTCRNRQGGYVCECPRGYTLSPQRACEDVDECSRFRGQVCASNSECINTQGSYTCNCNDGFKPGGTDKSCVDIDECAESPNICQQTCNNVWGSYQCSCKLGYTLSADERSCQDINECEAYGGIGSLCIGFCVNEPGSFKCSCPNGYKLSSDGRTCQDIDECQEQNICNDDKAVCLNTRGGYKCNYIECPPNYVRDKDHRNRCKRPTRNCQGSSEECLKDPLSYSYNYITFVSNMRLPLSGQLDLFTMRGPRFQSTTVQFDLELKDARAPQGTSVVTKDFFRLRRTNYNEAMVSLIKTIQGPQEIELDLIMKIYHNGLFGGTALAKIYIFVTEYEF